MNEQAEALNKTLRGDGINPPPPAAPRGAADSDGGGDGESRLPLLELPREGLPLSKFARECGAVVARNGVFVRDQVPVTVRFDGYLAAVESMSPERFRTYIEGQAVTIKWKQKEQGAPSVPVPHTMNVNVAKGVLASDVFLKQQRPLTRINTVRQPVERADGRIELLNEGYDEESQTLTLRSPVVIREDMPLEEAKTFLRDLHKEFPFAKKREDGNSRGLAVHLSAMLSLFAAGLQDLREPRLGFVYDSNVAGGGKNLLVKLAVIPTLGALMVNTIPDSKEEFRKILDTTAKEGAPYLFLDELEGNIKNRELNAFFTSDFVKARRMNTQESFSAPKMTICFLAGNNLSLSPDIGRRTLQCPLYVEEADIQARPISRVLTTKVLERPAMRGDILSALWAIVREWSVRGRPKGSTTNRSFETWSEIFGGLVEFAGFGNPLEPGADDETKDDELDDMKVLLKALSAHLGKRDESRGMVPMNHEYTFEELIECAVEHNCFAWKIEGKWVEEKIAGCTTDKHFEVNQRCANTMGKLFSRKFGGQVFLLKTDDGVRRVRFGHHGKNRQKRYEVKLEV